AGDVAPLDGLLDPYVAVAGALRLHVTYAREPLLESATHGDGGPRGPKGERREQELRVVAALRGVLALQADVRVGVDQAGQHGGRGQVDDARPGRRGGAGRVPYGLDATAAHDDHLVALGLIGPAVDQRAGADHRDRRGRGGGGSLGGGGGGQAGDEHDER